MTALQQFRAVTTVALTVLLAACGDTDNRPLIQELTGSTMGTTYSIKMAAMPDGTNLRSLHLRVGDTLQAIEQRMSTYLPDSELSRFNAQQGQDWFRVSAELCTVVDTAQRISAMSDGAFDITVGPVVNLWGFGPGAAIDAPPARQSIAAAMQKVGYSALHTDCSVPALRKDIPDLYLDLSAFAKGYGVDQVALLLDEHRIENYLVEIGGELRLRGKNAQGSDWGVAIESPNLASRSVHTIVNLSNVAVATSGDYRNFFEHDGTVYSHTIDPRSGYPVSHRAASVTVMADNAAFADAIATALLVLGPDDGPQFAERENIAALFLLRGDGAIEERSTTQFAALTGQ